MRTALLMALLFCFMTPLMTSQNFPDAQQLNTMAARFAPTPLRVDVSKLSPGDRQAVVKLIEAARILDPLYMKQLWKDDLATYEKVKQDHSALGQARAHYYWINKSPWSALDNFQAFMPGVPAHKPLGANFYPEDMTKEQFEAWEKTLPADQKELATGFFSVIRRDPSGKLKVVPYSEEYKPEMEQLAKLFREAAALTDNATLKTFLTSRADAFLSNDYRPSDVAWMDLDAPLDITFGPYETYNDELFGYKAAYEAYINVRDDAESKKLEALTAHLQDLENNLPEDPQYRNPKLGAGAPMRVVNQIIASGDGGHGITTAAYNLPNDEEVVKQKGSKRVMLKNVQEAKFKSVLIPIARKMLPAAQFADVSFEPFFTHIVAHELMHGLGPHVITVQGRETNPRKELKDLYSAIEEAKADATGLWALGYLMDHAKELHLTVLKSDEAAQRQLYTTFLASSFRTLRFGTGDAHGKGMVIQFNYLLKNGGFVQNPDGTYSVNFAKIKDAVRGLTHELLTVEATGDYAGAKRMLDEGLNSGVKQQLGKLQGIPVDIEPQFVTADELAPVAAAKPQIHNRKMVP